MKNINSILDISGCVCPESMMKFRRCLRSLSKGKKLLVITDDPTTIYDIPNFCYFMKHRLIYKKIEAIPYKFLIIKN